jgi:hypothetical protein
MGRRKTGHPPDVSKMPQDRSCFDRPTALVICKKENAQMARIALTKTDMARVIVCAMWGLGDLPNVDDRRVRIEARKSAAKVSERHMIALRVIEQRSATALIQL